MDLEGKRVLIAGIDDLSDALFEIMERRGISAHLVDLSNLESAQGVAPYDFVIDNFRIADLQGRPYFEMDTSIAKKLQRESVYATETLLRGLDALKLRPEGPYVHLTSAESLDASNTDFTAVTHRQRIELVKGLHNRRSKVIYLGPIDPANNHLPGHELSQQGLAHGQDYVARRIIEFLHSTERELIYTHDGNYYFDMSLTPSTGFVDPTLSPRYKAPRKVS